MIFGHPLHIMTFNMMKSFSSHFLIASPHLHDSNFARSVVLLIQHDEDGAFGVVLNRTSDKSIREIWEDVVEQPCDSDQMVHVGGPVVGPLMALHTMSLFSDSEVMPGLFISTQKDQLERIVRGEDSEFRLYSGYAGWAAGQLEHELTEGGWVTKPADREDIFLPAERLWEKVARDLTDDILISRLNIKNVPDDPSMN